MNANRAIRRAFFVASGSLLILFMIIGWLIFPSPDNPPFSSNLSPEEQRAIVDTVHRHRVKRAVQALSSGRFEFAFSRLREIPRTIIFESRIQEGGKLHLSWR